MEGGSSTVDATSTIDSDLRNSFHGFTLPQPPSNEPSHVRSSDATINDCNCQKPQLAATASTRSTNTTMKEVNSCALAIPTDFLTSPVCTAVLVDARIALARFMVGLGRIRILGIGWAWKDTRRRFVYTQVKLKTLI